MAYSVRVDAGIGMISNWVTDCALTVRSAQYSQSLYHRRQLRLHLYLSPGYLRQLLQKFLTRLFWLFQEVHRKNKHL